MFEIVEMDYLMQCVDERKSMNHVDRANKGAMLMKLAQLINQAQQQEPEPEPELEPTKGGKK